MSINLAVFALAAFFEIAGCFAFWIWVRRGATPFVVVLGVASLVGFALSHTPWERNPLQLLADAHTRNEVSRHLGASASEINALLEKLFAAMGVATEAEAIAAAHKRGLFKEAWAPRPVTESFQ